VSSKVLQSAIKKFNSREFFECHDILEDYWFECKAGDKDFIQGLLHYAVAFHHLIDKNNPAGAKLQFKKCIKRLKPYGKNYKGINIDKITLSAGNFIKRIAAGAATGIRIPSLTLQS
jgi:predicted metal-dependent hydrolase